jgi:hypothetical protein
MIKFFLVDETGIVHDRRDSGRLRHGASHRDDFGQSADTAAIRALERQSADLNRVSGRRRLT